MIEPVRIVLERASQVLESDRRFFEFNNRFFERVNRFLDRVSRLLEPVSRLLGRVKRLLEGENCLLVRGNRFLERVSWLLDRVSRLLDRDNRLENGGRRFLEQVNRLLDRENALLERASRSLQPASAPGRPLGEDLPRFRTFGTLPAPRSPDMRLLLEIILAAALIALVWEKSLKERVSELPWIGDKTAPVVKTPERVQRPQPRPAVTPAPSVSGAWMWDANRKSALDTPSKKHPEATPR